ncbi:hypothetical protein F5B17DRAFT_453832 [Nemania serpens]|nr:hypothetical protein F5B17DRAFT_453832 [Nemania serpens]
MGNVMFNNRERNAVERWIAVSLLRQGQYEQAAKRFNSLLESIDAQAMNKIIEISIRRNLALASACQGEYQQALRQISAAKSCFRQAPTMLNMSFQSLPRPSETMAPQVSTGGEIQENDLQYSANMKILHELTAARDNLHLTKSKVYYMWGDFKTALAWSDIALRRMKERWGGRHFKTFECASYHSMLLAFNSRILEADTACNLTFADARSELGSQHPQTLETLGHLVKIFQFQARLTEAGDTARSLAKTTQSSLTEEHPQTHLSRHLVAETLLAVGDYVSAEFELEGIITTATRMYGEYHPDILSYHSWLALARYHTGKLQGTEKLAISVLQKQQEIYMIARPDKITPEETYDRAGHRWHVESLSEFRVVLNDVLDSINNNSDERIHQRLLETLHTIALIAWNSEDLVNLDLQICQTIWEQNKFHLEMDSTFTLDSGYDLALAYQQEAERLDSDSSFEQAAKHLRLVYRKRILIFGPKHPDTVLARRELIIINCALGQWEPSLDIWEIEDTDDSEEVVDHDKGAGPLDDVKWGHVEAESRNIVYMNEGLVGNHHPETLRSLLWLLIVQVLRQDENGADETLRKGLQRLRHASVRRERFIESLSLERRFAFTVLNLGDEYEAKAFQISCVASYNMEQQLRMEPGPMRKTTESLKTKIDNKRDALFFKASRHRKKLEAELQMQIERAEEGSYSEAAMRQAELWSLLASLDKPDNPRTLDARIELAEFHLLSTQYKEQEEGLQIIRELTKEYSNALTTTQRRRIRKLCHKTTRRHYAVQ